MTSSIDKRLERLLNKRDQQLRDRLDADALTAAKRLRQDDAWVAKQARRGKRAQQARNRERLWHQRYFVATGQWHDDAHKYVVVTRALEVRLRIEHRRKQPRTGSGKRLRYVT